jgi:hypothetical protein
VAALRATHCRLAKLFYKVVEIVVTGTNLPEELDQFGIGGLIGNRLCGSIRHGSEFTRAAEPAGSRERTQEFEIALLANHQRRRTTVPTPVGKIR